MKNRHSIRLRSHDYSLPGSFFVTICTQNRKYLFGNVKNNKMILNKYGHIVLEEWLKTVNLRANIILDDFIVMPNHFHVIIILGSRRGTACRAPTVPFNNSPWILLPANGSIANNCPENLLQVKCIYYV